MKRQEDSIHRLVVARAFFGGCALVALAVLGSVAVLLGTSPGAAPATADPQQGKVPATMQPVRTQTADVSSSAAGLERKLQAFYNGLQPDEKLLMRNVLLASADGSDSTLGQSSNAVEVSFKFKVNGKVLTVKPTAGGDPTDPDRGKDGATTAGQPGGTSKGSGTKTVGITIKF